MYRTHRSKSPLPGTNSSNSSRNASRLSFAIQHDFLWPGYLLGGRNDSSLASVGTDASRIAKCEGLSWTIEVDSWELVSAGAGDRISESPTQNKTPVLWENFSPFGTCAISYASGFGVARQVDEPDEGLYVVSRRSSP